jgi:hypothetical protein
MAPAGGGGGKGPRGGGGTPHGNFTSVPGRKGRGPNVTPAVQVPRTDRVAFCNIQITLE